MCVCVAYDASILARTETLRLHRPVGALHLQKLKRKRKKGISSAKQVSVAYAHKYTTKVKKKPHTIVYNKKLDPHSMTPLF